MKCLVIVFEENLRRTPSLSDGWHFPIFEEEELTGMTDKKPVRTSMVPGGRFFRITMLASIQSEISILFFIIFFTRRQVN
jgi:hypothetical protein